MNKDDESETSFIRDTDEKNEESKIKSDWGSIWSSQRHGLSPPYRNGTGSLGTGLDNNLSSLIESFTLLRSNKYINLEHGMSIHTVSLSWVPFIFNFIDWSHFSNCLDLYNFNFLTKFNLGGVPLHWSVLSLVTSQQFQADMTSGEI